MEVIRLTGRPFSEQRAKWAGAVGENPFTPALCPSEGERENTKGSPFFGLAREAKDLHARINERVNLMFRRGLVEEVRELLKRGVAENRTAMQAIGYRQVVEHLRGERPLPETIELVKIRTRQFAKRQMTWFRRQAQVNWVSVGADEMGEVVAGRIIEMLAAET